MDARERARAVLKESVGECRKIFGVECEAYLYGSYARGDYDSESDIDIFVVVDLTDEEIASYRNDIASVTSELSLKYDITVSVIVKSSLMFKKYLNILPFYRNIVNEGIKYAI